MSKPRPTVADPADSAHKIGHVTAATPGGNPTLADPADSAHKNRSLVETTWNLLFAETFDLDLKQLTSCQLTLAGAAYSAHII